eukprot:g45032.t1
MMVILNKWDYLSKVQTLLADENTYRQVQTDPAPQLGNKNLNTLKRIKQTGQINKTDYLRMKPEGTNTSQFYGLPMVYKLEVPLRPIVSLAGTPAHRLAKELQRRLKHLVIKSPHSIHSAQEFLSSIKDIRIEDNETMVSFDVTALFTSIDIPLSRETLTTLLKQEHDPSDTISTDNMLKLL